MSILRSPESRNQLNVKVNSFEGPFDLLLHLIKKNEMDIYDVKIYDITNQYLDYLKSMKEMDLEITSEFIVIAATLLEIKSRELLPKTKTEEESQIDENDTRRQLLNRLMEYKKIKAAAFFLSDKQKFSGTVFSKRPEIIIEDKKDNSEILDGVTMLYLYNLFNDLMNKFINKHNTENVIENTITIIDAYKIEDKMEALKEKLKFTSGVYFSEVIKLCATKMEAIVTFLALLELIKLKNVKVVQGENFSDIYIEELENNDKDQY